MHNDNALPLMSLEWNPRNHCQNVLVLKDSHPATESFIVTVLFCFDKIKSQHHAGGISSNIINNESLVSCWFSSNNE